MGTDFGLRKHLVELLVTRVVNTWFWMSPGGLRVQSPGLSLMKNTAFLKVRIKEEKIKDEVPSGISDSPKFPISLVTGEQMLSVFQGNLIEIWINKPIESDVTEDTSL